MTIFIILFLVLFLILIFQIIRLIYFAIKKKELSKEVKKTCVVFLCNVFAFILVGMTAPENIKNKAKEPGIKKKAEKVKEVKKKVDKEKKQVITAKKKSNNCMFGIFCKGKTNKEKKEIKYEILRESSDINIAGSKRRNIDVLIPSCDISKNDMYKMLIPKLSVYLKGYSSLWVTFYCDRRFYKLYNGATNGSVKLIYDGKIDVDALKFHKTNELMTDKEIGAYTEYQTLLGSQKTFRTDEEKKKFEEEKRNILKKYNITENELIEIDSKGFSFTL